MTFYYNISTSPPSTVLTHHATSAEKLKKAVKNTIVIMTMTVTFLWLWKHGHHQFHGTFHGLKITNYQCEECDKWRLVFSKKKLMWISFWWVLVFILYLFFFSLRKLSWLRILLFAHWRGHVKRYVEWIENVPLSECLWTLDSY